MSVRGVWEHARSLAIGLVNQLSAAGAGQAFTIVFSHLARTVDATHLPRLEADGASPPYGANFEHALREARSLLTAASPPPHCAFLISDDLPTAHLDESGGATFAWPPTLETVARTEAEVEACQRAGVLLSVIALGTNPPFSEWATKIAEDTGGIACLINDRLEPHVVDARRDYGTVDAGAVLAAALEALDNP